jgi:hypothetical protein
VIAGPRMERIRKTFQASHFGEREYSVTSQPVTGDSSGRVMGRYCIRMGLRELLS